jgi:hypothetical protein
LYKGILCSLAICKKEAPFVAHITSTWFILKGLLGYELLLLLSSFFVFSGVVKLFAAMGAFELAGLVTSVFSLTLDSDMELEEDANCEEASDVEDEVVEDIVVEDEEGFVELFVFNEVSFVFSVIVVKLFTGIGALLREGLTVSIPDILFKEGLVVSYCIK